MAVIAYQYRGDLVDQIHRGHIAVTDHTGRILWKLGDPERLTFARSSAKPPSGDPRGRKRCAGALWHYPAGTGRHLFLPQRRALSCKGRGEHPAQGRSPPDQLCLRVGIPHVCPRRGRLEDRRHPPGAHLLRLLRKARRYAHHRPPFRGVFGRLYCFGSTPSSGASSRCSLKCAA